MITFFQRARLWRFGLFILTCLPFINAHCSDTLAKNHRFQRTVANLANILEADNGNARNHEIISFLRVFVPDVVDEGKEAIADALDLLRRGESNLRSDCGENPHEITTALSPWVKSTIDACKPYFPNPKNCFHHIDTLKSALTTLYPEPNACMELFIESSLMHFEDALYETETFTSMFHALNPRHGLVKMLRCYEARFDRQGTDLDDDWEEDDDMDDDSDEDAAYDSEEPDDDSDEVATNEDKNEAPSDEDDNSKEDAKEEEPPQPKHSDSSGGGGSESHQSRLGNPRDVRRQPRRNIQDSNSVNVPVDDQRVQYSHQDRYLRMIKTVVDLQRHPTIQNMKTVVKAFQWYHRLALDTPYAPTFPQCQRYVENLHRVHPLHTNEIRRLASTILDCMQYIPEGPKATIGPTFMAVAVLLLGTAGIALALLGAARKQRMRGKTKSSSAVARRGRYSASSSTLHRIRSSV